MIILKAAKDKVFRRKADGQIFGKEIKLGYSYYIGGVKLDTPHRDSPSDFEQITDPKSLQKEKTKIIKKGGTN